jgi:membrane-associated protease RseP (regulator of RpoE activity)
MPTEPVAGASPLPPVAEESPALDTDAEPISAGPRPFRWKTNLLLFLATVVTTFYAGVQNSGTLDGKGFAPFVRGLPMSLLAGWRFAVPLLAILLTHEFGHYIAARVHRVDASLPYFIPLPHYSPFGTMGAVISMRGRIRSRDALLDIGASGPLAGLAVALPVLVYGLSRSQVLPLGAHGEQEGQCLLYLLIKRLVVGPIPDGYDVFLDPIAFAGWAGLFVTMLNLVAVAQLDGGHIAYALFGPKQNRYARALHALLLVVFAFNLARNLGPLLVRRIFGGDAFWMAVANSTFWLVWYVIIAVIKRLGGEDHPPTEPGELSPLRKGIAVLSLVLFVLLFMPTPMSQY